MTRAELEAHLRGLAWPAFIVVNVEFIDDPDLGFGRVVIRVHEGRGAVPRADVGRWGRLIAGARKYFLRLITGAPI